jgi:hypothetical protein
VKFLSEQIGKAAADTGTRTIHLGFRGSCADDPEKAGVHTWLIGDRHPYAGEMTLDQVVELLGKFGMLVGLDPSGDRDMQAMQMWSALQGCVQARVIGAEAAYRDAGAKTQDLNEASLMSFAGINCRGPVDELGYIHWQALRLAGALQSLDFPGPIPRDGELGSGDTLMRTIRLVAAALAAMTNAAAIALNMERDAGASAESGQLLVRAMDALEEAAKDIPLHRATGDLMRLVD